MRRLRFEVAYDGADFNGWQMQPGLPTIQGILEQIIGDMEGKRVHVAGSGRTDAGVHALAQVAAVSLENPIPPENFRRAVNRLLPPSIRIGRVTEAALDFHPRFDALQKTYEYRLYRGEVCPPFVRRYVGHYPYPLDESAMCAAAPLLKGEHDFTAFAASDGRDAPERSKVRTIFDSNLTRQDELLVYRVTGSGFLKHMVRNIVGVLLEVGKGNLTNDDILARFVPRCGIPAGPTALPSGLFLVSVLYD
ncbi:MAG TPA: tRNA pseudouridine(38-40) synthase TruA [Bryobacteraceae bacterium]|nr:tRNA pseudouridine(38-40) synthase TruA [Bryobacteraceae bacterium]